MVRRPGADSCPTRQSRGEEPTGGSPMARRTPSGLWSRQIGVLPYRCLFTVELADGVVRGEAPVVEGDPLECCIRGAAPVFGHCVRRDDLVPVGEPVRPEGGVPRLIERLECLVPVAQPGPEGRRAQVAIAGATVLVADV